MLIAARNSHDFACCFRPTVRSLGAGDPPLRTVYYVAEEDANKAEAIIASVMAPNEKVEAYGLLPEAAVKALKLKPGEFITA